MDRVGVAAEVNLNGGTGTSIDSALKASEPYRDRVADFMTWSDTVNGINPHVKKILDSVRLSSFFVMADDESSALSKVKEIGSGKSGESARPAKGKKGASEAPGPETVPSE